MEIETALKTIHDRVKILTEQTRGKEQFTHLTHITMALSQLQQGFVKLEERLQALEKKP